MKIKERKANQTKRAKTSNNTTTNCVYIKMKNRKRKQEKEKISSYQNSSDARLDQGLFVGQNM